MHHLNMYHQTYDMTQNTRRFTLYSENIYDINLYIEKRLTRITITSSFLVDVTSKVIINHAA